MFSEYRNIGVYGIQNKITGFIWIGRTYQKGKVNGIQGFKKRWSYHLAKLRKGEHGSKKFQQDYDLYGEDAFNFVVIEVCEIDMLQETEQKWLDFYDGLNKLYNIRTKAEKVTIRAKSSGKFSGEKNPNHKLSEQDRLDIIEARKNGAKAKELAKKYNVHFNHIYRVSTDKPWGRWLDVS